jgi:hypothetical protein
MDTSLYGVKRKRVEEHPQNLQDKNAIPCPFCFPKSTAGG